MTTSHPTSGLPAPQDGPQARSVLLARHPATDPDRGEPVVHLLPLPDPGPGPGGPADSPSGPVSALCGFDLDSGELNTVTPETGAWCQFCYLIHVIGTAPDPNVRRSTPSAMGRDQAVTGYRRLGWPITLRGTKVLVDLDALHAVAVLVPVRLANQVTAILVRRRCTPAVLMHPALATHHVFLGGERFGVPLGWPAGTHRVTGNLPLPPTLTAWGPLRWSRPPTPHSLTLCREFDREFDIAAALRAATHTPPPAANPPAANPTAI